MADRFGRRLNRPNWAPARHVQDASFVNDPRRSGHQQERRRKQAAHAMARTSAQDELTIDCKKVSRFRGQVGLPTDAHRHMVMARQKIAQSRFWRSQFMLATSRLLLN